ncbi:hypothetical protein TNCV_2449611 [Trichonephila clavipes]|uniref:Uncharacterized protein n=1 Tax=Trichonephila clavipes TaxID=2585209 RepID=A0A8X6REE8_TRICX|nr:hypothetical protein TNCV_2449611 [Trichonephila clavipes]
MIVKAWKAVTPLTIHSCFKKSGFPSPNLVDVDGTLTEFNAEPSLWEALPEQGLTFDDFVLVDTDIAAWHLQAGRATFGVQNHCKQKQSFYLHEHSDALWRLQLEFVWEFLTPYAHLRQMGIVGQSYFLPSAAVTL